MSLKRILEEQVKLFKLDKETIDYLNKETENIIEEIEQELKKKKINAEVFLGGSLAKGTLIKKENHDIDVFVRFDWRIDDISNVLEGIVESVGKKLGYEVSKMHGSRDYFRIAIKDNLYFEIIPLCRIKNPQEARNVTDLSYFHVNYVTKKLKGNKIADEILLAKQFCHANGIYGAETYIQGFSGYGLECLIIYYKSFVNMLRKLVQVKDRIVIDPEKHYKKSADVLFSLNESRLQSPVILIDPTWKERNILSGLSKENFKKFQEKAREFLKKPSNEFFKLHELDIEELEKLSRQKNYELIATTMKTDRQEGDIAGTKMKKFSKLLESELRKYFDVFRTEFDYREGNEANFYAILKTKKEIIKNGPPVSMAKNAEAFKKANRDTFVKAGSLYARQKLDFSAREFLKNYIKEQGKKLTDMGITLLKIKND